MKVRLIPNKYFNKFIDIEEAVDLNGRFSLDIKNIVGVEIYG